MGRGRQNPQRRVNTQPNDLETYDPLLMIMGYLATEFRDPLMQYLAGTALVNHFMDRPDNPGARPISEISLERRVVIHAPDHYNRRQNRPNHMYR